MKIRLLVNTAFLALLGVTAFGTYTLKHNVERTAGDVRALSLQIDEERDTINVLSAEWAHLNRPERLQELARRYLSLEPLPAARIVPADALPAALIDQND